MSLWICVSSFGNLLFISIPFLLEVLSFLHWGRWVTIFFLCPHLRDIAKYPAIGNLILILLLGFQTCYSIAYYYLPVWYLIVFLSQLDRKLLEGRITCWLVKLRDSTSSSQERAIQSSWGFAFEARDLMSYRETSHVFHRGFPLSSSTTWHRTALGLKSLSRSSEVQLTICPEAILSWGTCSLPVFSAARTFLFRAFIDQTSAHSLLVDSIVLCAGGSLVFKGHALCLLRIVV